MLSYLLAALESEEDKRRFTELYEENHVRAEQTALRILRDPHDAEDAVQNAFLQVIHHFDEISPELFDHCLLLKNGQIYRKGLIEEVFQEDVISAFLGVPVQLEQSDNGYYSLAF